MRSEYGSISKLPIEEQKAYKAKKDKVWRSLNKDRLNANRRLSYREDKNKFYEWNKRSSIKRKYGLSVEQYESILKSQNGKCAICGREEKQKSLAIDHDHKSGEVRFLLCGMCNRGIGLLQEDSDLLRKAADYLDFHRRLKSDTV